MLTKPTILSVLSMVMCLAEMSGQGVLAPTLISATNAFPEGGAPNMFCTRGDAYFNFSAAPTGSTTRTAWRTAGTTASTQSISNVPMGVSGDLIGIPGMLYFSQVVSKGHCKLYASNGAPNSEQLVPTELSLPQLNVGSALGATYIFSVGGRVLYCTNRASALVELKRFTSIGSSFAAFSGKVFFAAATGAGDMELWSTDGTPAVTVLFKDILPGTATSDPQDLQVVGNRLYFTAVSSTGGNRELWSSSGLAFNTMKVKEIGKMKGRFVPLDPSSLAFPQKFYFIVEGGASDAVWESNGTPEGTKKLALPLASVSKMELLPVVDGWVRFLGRDIAGNSHVYKITFYTNSSMAPVAAIEYSLPSGTSGKSVGLCNGKLFYTSSTGLITKLWTLAAGGPKEVRPTNAQISWKLLTSPLHYAVLDNWLYFSGDASGGGYELYKVQ